MIAYLASSKLAGALAGGVIPKPLGTVADDVMVALASSFGGAAPPAGLGVTGGWDKLGEVVQPGVPANQYTTALFVRRAGEGEPESYELIGAAGGGWRLAVVSTYRGCRTEGAPYDDFSLERSAGAYTSAIASSVDALSKNGRLVWLESNEQGLAHNPPPGFTERIDAEASIADAAKPIEGPSGAIVGSVAEPVYTVTGLVALASEPPDPGLSTQLRVDGAWVESESSILVAP